MSDRLLNIASKALGAGTAFVCFICGITSMISLSIGCIIAGILLIVMSIVTAVLEVPICCAAIPQLHGISSFTERRSALERAIFYGICAILPISMCFCISTVFTCLLLVASCAFNVWRFIRERRAGSHNTTADTSAAIIGGPPPHSGTTTTSAYTDNPPPPYGYGDGNRSFQGQVFEKAATETFKSMVGPGTGQYTGF